MGMDSVIEAVMAVQVVVDEDILVWIAGPQPLDGQLGPLALFVVDSIINNFEDMCHNNQVDTNNG